VDRTSTRGREGLWSLPGSPEDATRSSSSHTSAAQAGAVLARWSAEMGLCTEAVCGTHLSQSQSPAVVFDAKAVTISSAGECNVTACSTRDLATGRMRSRAPDTPIAPVCSGSTTTGTSCTTDRPSSEPVSSSQAWAVERPRAGSFIELRDGSTPWPSRSRRNPGVSCRRIHSSGLSRQPASAHSAPQGCSSRRWPASTSSD